MTRKFWVSRRFKLCAVLIIMLAAAVSLLSGILWRTGLTPADPPGANRRHAPAVGHLGGHPVVIPSEYANLLEYDDDPHFMTPRKGTAPVRTAQSGIRSFGFDISYARLIAKHALHTVQGPALEQVAKFDLYIGISANSHYYGDEQVVFLVDSIATRLGEPYARQEKDMYGLESYAPARGELDTSSKLNSRRKDIYIHRHPGGDADAYIRCNWPAGKVCTLNYSLSPDLKASVELQFPRHLLPEWKSLQSAASLMILGFRTPQ